MAALPTDAIAGLFGKLPARGDFVRENLPRDFTDSWDDWWQRGLAERQERPRGGRLRARDRAERLHRQLGGLVAARPRRDASTVARRVAGRLAGGPGL